MGHVIYQPKIVGDFLLEVALKHVANYHSLNKFGSALDCDNGIPTDIWDGADGTLSTDIWVAPTQARIHAVESSQAADKGTPTASTGARTVEVFGLTAWDNGIDTSEIVTLNGVTPVNTVNSYVIIHRMIVRTAGSGGANAGIIKATAAVDGTITAAIQAGNGQTLMCIYGIPDGYWFAIHALHTSVQGNQTAEVLGQLLVKENADQADSLFVVKREWSFRRDDRLDLGSIPPMLVRGPAIVKIQVTSNMDGVPCHGNFDGIVHEKRTNE